MGIIFAIAISNVANIIQNSKYNAILKNEIFLIKAAQTYLSTYQEDYPIEIGQTNEITLDTLINNNFIPKIKNPLDNGYCSGYVIVTKIGENSFDFTPRLNCLVEINNVEEDSIVAYWKLDGNLLDFSINSYTATNNGATLTTNRFNEANKAYSFDGTDDYIETNFYPSALVLGNTFTWSFG